MVLSSNQNLINQFSLFHYSCVHFSAKKGNSLIIYGSLKRALISRVSCASVKNIALSWAEIRTDISFIAVSFKSYYMLG